MSEQWIAELYERLTSAKTADRARLREYPFLRGWNAAIDFAIKQMKLTSDEKDAA